MQKHLKIDLYFTGLYLCVDQIAIYFINHIIAQRVNQQIAGHYFTTMAILTVSANILLLGGNSVLIKTVPILKKQFSNSILANIYYLLAFFLRFFIAVLLIAIVLDWFFFQAHLNQINYNWGHYYDPGGLFLFIIFFMLIANYFTAFLRAYNYIKTIYCTAIAGILLQIFLVYISKTHIIYFSINQQHNLVYNFITFSFLNYLLCSCILVLCVIFFILPKISKVNKSSEELYQTWKLDIKFFTLSSLQANLRFLLIIIIKIFSPNSHDVTKFAYVFGIIGFIYIIRKLSKQTSQTVIAKYIAYNNYLALRQYIAKFIAFNLITVAAIVVAIIELRQIYLTHFGLTHYYNLMLLLMLSESLIAIFEPLFSNFLLFYNQSSLKFISILKITYCILLAALTMLVVSYYHLSGTLILCFGSSLVLIIIQTIAFLHYLKQFKLHQLI